MIELHGISVVVCTYNGKERLRETLLHIVQQRTSCNWELIIVDNASTDDTYQYCKDYLSQYTQRVAFRLFTENKPGLNNARMRGLIESSYEWVLFCDDDNWLQANYLESGFHLLQSHSKIGALGGCGVPVFTGQKPAWFHHYSHSFAVGPQAAADGKIPNRPAELYGAGAFFRKELLLNFFNRGYEAVMSDRMGKSLVSGGDVEYCYIVQLFGYEIWYDSSLVFSHQMPEGRMTWNYYLRLKAGIAAGSAKLLPYSELLMNSNSSLTKFILSYLSKTIFSLGLYAKHRMRQLLSPKQITEKELLIRAVNAARATSYLKNIFIATGQFRRLSKLIANQSGAGAP